MDWTIIIAKIVGAVLLAFTARSIFKHIKDRKRIKVLAQQDAGATPPEAHQSRSEAALNSAILYLWHAFMIAFSVGMIVNN